MVGRGSSSEVRRDSSGEAWGRVTVKCGRTVGKCADGMYLHAQACASVRFVQLVACTVERTE